MAGSYTRWPATPNGITPYATYADLPALAVEGSFAVTLDTDTLYVYDSGWIAIAGPTSVLSVGTIDTGTPSANGAHVDSSALIMQSASATVPGLVNTTTQTFAGTKIFAAIGVNNTYPISALLDVHGSGNATPQIQANNVGTQSSGGGAVIQVGADPGAAMTSGSRLGGFQFFGTHDAAHTTYVGAAINAFATQAWTGSAQGTQLKFNITANGTTSRVTALTIDQDSSATFTGNISAANLSGTNTGDVTIGAVAGSSSTTGATISGQVLTLTPADLTNPGLMTASAQTFGGAKTFNSTISASNLSGTNTGDVAIGTANGLSISGQLLSLGLSSTSTAGALSANDWNTFNGKQAAGSYITALTGDATASGPGSAALTLATVNANVGSFGNATSVATFTVNAKGLITAAATTAISGLARTALASGTAYRLLANDSSGVMSENAALTSTRIPFADANGQLTDSSSFVWNNSTGNLGVGNTAGTTNRRIDVGASTGTNALRVRGGTSSSGDGGFLAISQATTEVFYFGAESAVRGNTNYSNLTIDNYGASGNITFAINGSTAANIANDGTLTANAKDVTARVVANNSAATASSTKRIYDAQYTVDGDCTGGYFYTCLNSSGTVIGRIEAASNTTTTFTGSSDARLKQNPASFDALDLIAQMEPKEYEWKSNPGVRQKGFYAQELYDVFPEAVSVGSDDLTEDGNLRNPWGIDYSRLTPVLVKAIQELVAQNQELIARIEVLENEGE